MSPLYVYALLDRPPAEPVSGLRGESVQVLDLDGLLVAAGSMDELPPAEVDTLASQDAVVRRLWKSVDSILPARFGTLVRGEEELRRLVAARAGELGAALRLVKGREQMNLRVTGEAAPKAETPKTETPKAGTTEPAGLGPGALHLERLRRAHEEARSAIEIADLAPALAPLVFAERVERGAARRGVAIYHLIERGAAVRYRQIVERGAQQGRLRIEATGPWPPYAFAPAYAFASPGDWQ